MIDTERNCARPRVYWPGMSKRERAEQLMRDAELELMELRVRLETRRR